MLQCDGSGAANGRVDCRAGAKCTRNAGREAENAVIVRERKVGVAASIGRVCRRYWKRDVVVGVLVLVLRMMTSVDGA